MAILIRCAERHGPAAHTTVFHPTPGESPPARQRQRLLLEEKLSSEARLMRCAAGTSRYCKASANSYPGNTSSVTANAVPPSPQGEGFGCSLATFTPLLEPHRRGSAKGFPRGEGIKTPPPFQAAGHFSIRIIPRSARYAPYPAEICPQRWARPSSGPGRTCSWGM